MLVLSMVLLICSSQSPYLCNRSLTPLSRYMPIKFLLCCRPPEALDSGDGLHHKAVGIVGQASPELLDSDRLMGRQSVLAKQARPAPHRALADITNTAKIAARKPKAAENIEGYTAASVPDLVTFWEQRACVQQQ